MYNAMFKKNPLMSLWMSAANSAAGSARGLWMAELHRQQRTMMQDLTKQMINFWSGARGAQMGSTGEVATQLHKTKRRR
jgi:hypothetical protein